MKILGRDPDEAFLEYIKEWVANTPGIEAEALIFANTRSCLMVGTKNSTRPWVVFWNPSNKSSKSRLVPSHWYQWSTIPKSVKVSILQCHKRWLQRFNDESIRHVAPFSKRE
jgi:hypothetical protein